jgi:hypothetical protein
MRLIDADALLPGFVVCKVTEYDESGCGMSYKAVPVKAIENAPTIDAEPVRHGRWNYADVRKSFGVLHGVKCSECGVEGVSSYNYCPSCGAKMDLEDAK